MIKIIQPVSKYSKEWHEGYKAALDREPASHNPYVLDREETRYRDWDNGWTAGEKDDRG